MKISLGQGLHQDQLKVYSQIHPKHNYQGLIQEVKQESKLIRLLVDLHQVE